MQQSYLRHERAVRINRFMSRVVVCMVVACLFVYISRMAEISAGAKEINQIRQELVKMKEEQNVLRSSLEYRHNVDRIREEAISRLGMVYPENEQIRLISLNGYAADSNTQTALDSTTP